MLRSEIWQIQWCFARSKCLTFFFGDNPLSILLIIVVSIRVFLLLVRPGVSDYQLVVRSQLALGHRCRLEEDGQQNLRRLRD